MAKVELKVLIGLHRLTNLIDKETSKIVCEYDLTLGQFAILEVLFHKGQLSVGQVQEKILSSCGTMPIIVNNLEKRGYIIKSKDVSDKRKTLLDITEKGKNIIRQVYPKNEDKIVQIMSLLSNDELEQMAYLLKKFGEVKNEKTSNK